MSIFKKYFSHFFLIISILLLIYTYYRSEIYWSGLKRDYYLNYYILSISFISLSIITFYINEKIKTYLIIILISFLFSLYLFELYLVYASERSLRDLDERIKIYKRLTGKDYDTRNKIEIYNDLKKQDENISVAMLWVAASDKTQQIYKDKLGNKILPLSGISHSKTIHCNENGYYSIYQSDRYGFNNPDKEWDKKNIEYLLIGDSMVHGGCVNRPNDISSVLRNISKKNILNLGQGDTGPLLMYARFREYLKPNVSNVLWFYYEGNDYNDFNRELEVEILNKYLHDLEFTQNLKSKQNVINKIAKKQILEEEKIIKVRNETAEKENSFLFRIFKSIKIYNVRNLLHTILNPEPQHHFKHKEILKLSRDLAKKNNSNFFFVYLPSSTRYLDKVHNDNYNNVIKIVEELNIPIINIHKEVLEKEIDPSKLFVFGQRNVHYNIEGYKKIAEKIHSFVLKY